MKKILITTDFTLTEGVKIMEIASGHKIVFKDRLEVTPEDMRDTNIILGNITPKLFADTPNLEWVQLQTAGTDGYLKEGVLGEKVMLTNVTGAFGSSIAEYVLGAVLMMKNYFHTYIRHQDQKVWKRMGVSNLKGSTVVILGLGDIGRETAKRMKVLGANVIAIKRRQSDKPDYVDELYYEKDIDLVLPRADVLVLAMPYYKEVKHIIDRRRLSLLKRDAILVNVARGALIDQEAFTETLLKHRIMGAVLDVFEKEPLPEDDILWTLDNVVITPHNAGGFSSPMARQRVVEIMMDNLKRYLNGDELINVIDKKTGYCI